VGLFGASDAWALAINIDFGTTFGTPSNSYGAAAGHVGYWNGIVPTSSGPHALLNLAGAPSGVTLTISAGEASFSSNDPSTSGDDQALLDDELDIRPIGVGNTATVTLIGLPADTYDVYTYARDADTPANEEVSVNVNGVGGQNVMPTSDTFSGFALGENYALHTVTIAAGQNLSIVVTIVQDPGADYGMINGIQLVPEPRSALLLAAGLILLAAHRHRHLGRRGA
jgi:hypothetical protein